MPAHRPRGVRQHRLPDCGDGPFIAGEFGLQMTQRRGKTPEPIDRWLTQNGWHHRNDLLVCGDHVQAARI